MWYPNAPWIERVNRRRTAPGTPSSPPSRTPLARRAPPRRTHAFAAAPREWKRHLRRTLSHGATRSAAYELRREEAARARAFSALAFVLAVVVLAEESLFDESPAASVLSLATFVSLAVAAAHAFRSTRDPLSYTRPVARALAGASLLGHVPVVPRGVFSPAPMVTTVAVAFFGLGEDKAVAYGFTAVAGLAYGAVAWLVATGALPDPGVTHATGVSVEARLAMIAFVPLVYAMTLWHARLNECCIR